MQLFVWIEGTGERPFEAIPRLGPSPLDIGSFRQDIARAYGAALAIRNSRKLNNNRGNNRRRGRNNRPQGGQQHLNRIDSRARGNAPQLLDKYKKLAEDAHRNGDRVQAEYYFQFADHYFRVIADGKARQDEQRARRDEARGDRQSRDDSDDDDGQDEQGETLDPVDDNPFIRDTRKRRPSRNRREQLDDEDDDSDDDGLDPDALPPSIADTDERPQRARRSRKRDSDDSDDVAQAVNG